MVGFIVSITNCYTDNNEDLVGVLMTIGVIIKDLLSSLRKKPATVLYPDEKLDVPEGFRGRIKIDSKKCIACSKCFIVCPAKAIDMVTDEKHTEVEFNGKKICRLRVPKVDLFICIRCGLCEEVCPTKAIHLTNKFSGSSSKKDLFVSVE
jgi:hydrogenase-4 component H